MIEIGPIPGWSAYHGTSWDEKGHADICQIFISYGELVNGIQFQYVKDGNLVLSGFHGKMGSNFVAVQINYPSEYVTGLRVSEGSSNFGRPDGVRSLTFLTNQRTLGPYGPSGENTTVSEIALGEVRQFGGFHGAVDRSGNLAAIGVYIQPCTTVEELASSSSESSVKR